MARLLSQQAAGSKTKKHWLNYRTFFYESKVITGKKKTLQICFAKTPSVACGDSSPKGTPLSVAAKFPAIAEAVPLGKVAANTVSRRKGYLLQMPFAVAALL